ncbi:hypothetical protein [Sphingomonas vulcanisoli]|uniref:hypothetical protein n=1 Tax=Sphingomonas vulcanisoli TaxID=1658060 RepID=UPI00141F6F77|nr:hypothetical protein [Sphingomonas vulcanisoli]
MIKAGERLRCGSEACEPFGGHDEITEAAARDRLAVRWIPVPEQNHDLLSGVSMQPPRSIEQFVDDDGAPGRLGEAGGLPPAMLADQIERVGDVVGQTFEHIIRIADHDRPMQVRTAQQPREFVAAALGHIVERAGDEGDAR